MFLDKLFILTALCALQGTITDIKEPNRALDEPNFTIYNGTDKTMIVYSNSTDEEYYIEPSEKLELVYEMRFNDWLAEFYGNFDDWSDSLWYEPFDLHSAPASPDWIYNGNISYFQVRTSYEYTGFGVYKHEYYDIDVDFFLDPNKWGGIQRGIDDWAGTRPLTKTDEYFRLYKENGSYITAKNLEVKRAPAGDYNPNYATLVYCTVNNQYINIANNFGYSGNVMTVAPTPGNDGEVQPYLLYYNGYSNRFRIGYEKPRDAENYPQTGYMPVDSPIYFTTKNIGYISYTESGQTEGFDAIKTGFDLVALSFGAIAPLFGYMIFPGMTLGFLLLIPTLIALTFAIIKLIKKGG